MLRNLWKRIEPWLTRAGHFDLVFVNTGLGKIIITSISGWVIAILGWWQKAPLYLVIPAAMVAMGAAVFIANQCLHLMTAWKAPEGMSRQEARRLDRLDPGGIRIGGNLAIVITGLSSALVIVAGLYAGNSYSTWKHDMEGTYVAFVVGAPQPNFDDRAHPLGVKITLINSGNLVVSGEAHTYGFAQVKQPLTRRRRTEIFAHWT